jgi:hypothetical protein
VDLCAALAAADAACLAEPGRGEAGAAFPTASGLRPARVHVHEREDRVRALGRARSPQPAAARGLGRWHSQAAELGPLMDERDGGARDVS